MTSPQPGTPAEDPSNEDASVLAGLRELASILVPGETLQAYAVQRRLFALTHRRTILGATSGRFIALERGLFGGFTPVDVRWQDVKDARIDVGVFGARISLSAFDRPDMAISGHTSGLTFDGLRKEQAQAVYRMCQAQEQAWREKRRVRELEELRARSGGIQMNNTSGGLTTPGAPNGTADATARLAQARDMLTQGLISDAEYEALKARIIGGL
jgi:hypothetical protein